MTKPTLRAPACPDGSASGCWARSRTRSKRPQRRGSSASGAWIATGGLRVVWARRLVEPPGSVSTTGTNADPSRTLYERPQGNGHRRLGLVERTWCGRRTVVEESAQRTRPLAWVLEVQVVACVGDRGCLGCG